MYVIYEGQEVSIVNFMTENRATLFERVRKHFEDQDAFVAAELVENKHHEMVPGPSLAYGYEHRGRYVSVVKDS